MKYKQNIKTLDWWKKYQSIGLIKKYQSIKLMNKYKNIWNDELDRWKIQKKMNDINSAKNINNTKKYETLRKKQ